MNGGPQHSIISFGDTDLFGLHCLNDADKTDFNETPRLRRRIEQDDDVQGVSIFTERGEKKSKIKRKHHAFRQDAFQHKEPRDPIVPEIVARALRRYNNHSTRSCICPEMKRYTASIHHGAKPSPCEMQFDGDD